MKSNNEQDRIRKKSEAFINIILGNSYGYEETAQRINYIKKIIYDCDKIIELEDLFYEIKIFFIKNFSIL